MRLMTMWLMGFVCVQLVVYGVAVYVCVSCFEFGVSWMKLGFRKLGVYMDGDSRLMRLVFDGGGGSDVRLMMCRVVGWL